MCLGIPGKIVEIWEENGTKMARVEFPGETRKVCLAYLPDLQVGDYVVAHAGFALTRLDEESALVTLKMMAEYGVIEDTLPGSAAVTGGAQ
ncbi:HypC/HybG/HupF family hydrogenase formation chaperone [Carbonactinospora thermoautotrophica]|uniref:Hydrogenase assembly chaperone hypC/hupF n=1 Tax=Carbonactinospora thermoautotrophica TaxID=1469144 RepID=A0A132MU18_9ACTN|nr:HypC/HybG/HupF family hydrogenase formation chaperone [Carbonactinospora thermoautotrophica]KWX01210.1 Hydrogenase assembly chaperone hypC/hupF [Carbonactinospora thermoautotrophica]KWX05554.1 hydrogenase assembly protein HypC [Carbonactinospora thermoautotrophica]KWX06919.1 hydrogenase assembly protein HypC [Carbonactinospora thermoautotrophica]MCX9192328.1 HypC/HybG/HupF family hydrogenase formation chaperone [Carbonactinospora thermoautotrophica]